MKMILTAGVLSAVLLLAAVHTVNAETAAVSVAGIETVTPTTLLGE